MLKPNDEYGGKGIVLGWESTDAEWEAALAAAVEEPYIVQERIALPDGGVSVGDRRQARDLRSHARHRAVRGRTARYIEGCMTRLGTAALLNVTAGGGSNVPTYVIEPR